MSAAKPAVQLPLEAAPVALLSPEALKAIDREIAKYPADQKQSAVMAALRIAQTEHGFLTPELEEAVAEVLEMPAIAVHEVASFYTLYNTKPTGRFKLSVCTNLPCALRSGNQAMSYLQAQLGIALNETTPDGLFTLKEGECMGACGDAPVLLVNNHRMCSFMSNDQIDALLSELRAQAAGQA